MNEYWKRLLEVERRIASADQAINRANQSLLQTAATLRNEGLNVTNPFGTTTGGTSTMVRFPTVFTVRVTWTVVPTLINAASQNVAADGPELAAAAADMVTGFVCSKPAATLVSSRTWAMSLDVGGSLYQRAIYNAGGQKNGYNWNSEWNLNKFDGGNFAIDYDDASSGTELDVVNIAKDPYTPRFFLSFNWPRRNFAGAIIGTDLLTAVRTFASTDTFTSGPIYGQSGSWSFAMACAATAYHNAGTGTIYLDW